MPLRNHVPAGINYTFLLLWKGTETSYHFFRSIGESESENMHLARLWREGFPERQFSRA